MKTLLALGEALIDLLEDPRAPGVFHRNAGGAPANVAVGFAKLGGGAFFLGALSTDAFGQYLYQQLEHHGVDLSHTVRCETAHTALAVVSLMQGERSFAFYRAYTADLALSPGHLSSEMFTQRPYLHLCSNSLTHELLHSTSLASLEMAERAGSLISFDINRRPALWSDQILAHSRVKAVLARAHLLKFTQEEWDWIAAGDPAGLAAYCFSGSCELITITDGSNPIVSITRSSRATHPAPPCVAIDTTAAGDSFVAALLWQLARHDIEAHGLRLALSSASWLKVQIAFAAHCGALTCTRYGAFDALPMRAAALQAWNE